MGRRLFFSRAERESNIHKQAESDRLVRSYKSAGVSFTAESGREVGFLLLLTWARRPISLRFYRNWKNKDSLISILVSSF